MMAIALLALMGCVAMAVDVGRLVVAAESAQNAADAAALSAAPLLGVQTAAINSAQQTVEANNQTASLYRITNQSGDITYYGPNSTVPGYGTLGPWAQAIQVTGRIPVAYTFGRAVGLTETTVVRRATAVRAPTGGCPVAPMWITAATPYNYGTSYQLLMADGPHYPDIPGNFSWLQLPSGVSASWSDVMAGMALSPQDSALMWKTQGDFLYGKTGLSVGQWRSALLTRISNGSSGVYTGDTFTSYHPGNPRILLIPLCTFEGGTGSNAKFKVVKLGAFWLDGVLTGGTKGISGRFIEFSFPGSGMSPQSPIDTGIYVYGLVR